MTELVDARPTEVVEISTAGGAFDDLSSLAWTAITPFVTRFSLRRGRRHERNSTVPASGSMTLDNSTDRRFDPTHTAGVYGTALAKPRRRIRKLLRWGTVHTITNATNATPIVITTSAAHGYATNDHVRQSGVFGNLAANGNFRIVYLTGTTYQLTNIYTAANVAGTGAYTSGGTAQRMFFRFHGYVPDFPQQWRGQNDAVVEVDLIDALSIFAKIPLPTAAWDLEVGADTPSWWFKPGSGSVAYDVSGGNHHGTYQGRPGFEPGIIPGYDGAGFAPNRDDTPGARASFPHKNLITGFPFTIEAVIRSGQERSAAKVITAAYDAAGSPTQQITLIIDSDSSGYGGKLRFRLNDVSSASTSTARSTNVVDDGPIHHVVAIAHSVSNLDIWVDGVEVTDLISTAATAFPDNLTIGYGIGNTPAVAFGDFSFATQPGDALGDVVIYNGAALSSTRIAAHSEAALTGWAGDFTGNRLHRLLDWIGWPSVDRAIDAGKTQVPAGLGGNLLSYIQALEKAEVGLTFIGRDGKVHHHDRTRDITAPGNVSQFTFGPGAGEVAYDAPAIWGSSEADIYTRAEGSRVGGQKLPPVISDAEGAAGNPGRRSLSEDGLLVETDEQVLDYLRYQLGLYDTPQTRVSNVIVKPQEDPTVVWPKILGAADGAMVTFTAEPPGGGSEFSQAGYLEACDETWTESDVAMSFGLSPADLTAYWILGTSTLETGSPVAVLGF